jgi:hypothetical protein
MVAVGCGAERDVMKRELPERSKHIAERLAEITAVIRGFLGDDLAMLSLS